MADFPFFKMAAVCHLGFLKVGNFNFRSSLEAQCAHRAKFREDRSNRSGDMADFRFSRLRPSAILDFQKLLILTSTPLRRPNVRHPAKFREDWSNRS